LTTVEELKRLNINSYYFQLHISIDNLASGHAARAATAGKELCLIHSNLDLSNAFHFSVKKYLEFVRVRFGAEVMQEQWRRVMIGFFLNEINPLKEDLANNNNPSANAASNAEEAMIKLIESKAPYAHNIHGHKSIQNKTLDDWLNPHEAKKNPSNTKEFLKGFANSFWITPGYPEESKFLTELCGFGGNKQIQTIYLGLINILHRAYVSSLYGQRNCHREKLDCELVKAKRRARGRFRW
jgi:hypothetical protein